MKILQSSQVLLIVVTFFAILTNAESYGPASSLAFGATTKLNAFLPNRFSNPFHNHKSSSNNNNNNNNFIVIADNKNSKSTSSSSNNGNGKKDFKSQFRSMLPILCSAFTAAAIMYPLDLVRALQMANAGSGLTTGELLSNFQKAHGWQGFFTQGLVPELARSTWMRFIKFALFPVVHMTLTGLPESKGNELTKAVSAIISSVPEALSIMPLEVAKIALQLDTKNVYRNNMFSAMGAVAREHGLSGLMIGYFGIQYRQAAWSAGYFASIKYFEKQCNKLFQCNDFNVKYPKASKTMSQLLSGFLAGVFGACFNTPGDTIRSNLQKRAFQGQKGLTFFGVGREIVANKGFTALYAGFKFKAFHLGGGGALMAFLIPFFTTIFAEKQQEQQGKSPLQPPKPSDVLPSLPANPMAPSMRKSSSL